MTGKAIRRAVACLALLVVLGGCMIKPPLPNTPPPGGDPYIGAYATLPPAPEAEPEPEPTELSVIVLQPTPIPVKDMYQAPDGALTPEDLVMMGIEHRSTLEKVLEELGEPLFREEQTEETTGIRTVTLAYDGLFLGFVGGSQLTSMTIATENWPGPRDVWIGAKLEDVLEAFHLAMPNRENGIPADGATATDSASGEMPGSEAIRVTEDLIVFYGDLQTTGHILPPKAELSLTPNENDLYVLRLIVPIEPYSEEDIRDSSYYFRQHAGCSFYFDKGTDRLSRIYWYVGILAE